MNIYDNPENYGLEIFLVLEQEPQEDFDGEDEFCMCAIWRRIADGKLFYRQHVTLSPGLFFHGFEEKDLHELKLIKFARQIKFYPYEQRKSALKEVIDYMANH